MKALHYTQMLATLLRWTYFYLSISVPVRAAALSGSAINTTRIGFKNFKPDAPVASGRQWDINDTALLIPRITSIITAQSGDTAFLPCHVTLKEEHGVSWVRRRDWYILTADSKVYSRDERVRVSYTDKPEPTWTLLIKFIRKEDEGVYDCQITTRQGATAQSIELRIVEPQAVLVGTEDVYVGVGSPFTITCVITNTLKPPEYVLWSVGSKPLNFGTDQGAVRHGNGGHSVTFDPGPPSVSRLAVHSATATDSGRYTCQPSSGLSATTNVHVALGNEMAAIQAADAAGRGSFRWMLLALSLTISVLNLYWNG